MEVINIRPKLLSEFKGKENIKSNLRVFIDSAKNQGLILDHILLYGVAGTGKTTLAQVIANEFNKSIKIIQGTQLKKNTDLINAISLITEGDFIFIDEIHAMNIECMETLYSVMEDFSIDIKIGIDNNQKITRVKIPHFTLIGATTNLNKIPNALEERFPIIFHFDLYEENEIYEIIKRTSQILKINLSDEEQMILASNAKGVPRIANNLLKRINDYKNYNQEASINEILNKLGIHTFGLKETDLKYLMVLENYDNDYVGLKTICALLDEDIQVIENKIEPFLLKKNLIKKTNKGRLITKIGKEVLNEFKLKDKSSN